MSLGLRPLIVVCGTTGVGKSNLAIELALHLTRKTRKKHKIINADAMQVYAGMDIITNKVPETEQLGVEHLLMGFRSPGQQYVVGQWVRDATKLIEEAHTNAEVPIVVGGTSYWIQHLLFPDRLVNEDPTETTAQLGARAITHDENKVSDQLREAMSRLPVELFSLFNALPSEPPLAADEPEQAAELHRLLSALDPPVGARWHWKDTRKTHRSLCILRDTGRLASELITEQSKSALKPRYRALCFWLYAQPPVLHERLNTRVDTMLERGLLEEVKALEEIAQTSASPNNLDRDTTDVTTGIYQSIGYREFHDFLNTDFSEQKDQEKSQASAVERMKISTRQYAKRQVMWLRNKLLPFIKDANLTTPESDQTRMFLLDATALEGWDTNVKRLAIDITDSFLALQHLPDPLLLSDSARDMMTIKSRLTDPSQVLEARRKMICRICTTNSAHPVMMEQGREWGSHLGSRAHRKMARNREKILGGCVEDVLLTEAP